MEEYGSIKEKEEGLEPYLSPLGAWSLAVGTAIGWGSFVFSSNMYLSEAGPMGSALGMLAGMVIMLFISRNYHYLMNRYPAAGGVYTYVKKIFGYDRAFLSFWFLGLAYLLREGLDLPEVSCIAILDADKEGFLRSDTAMVQTIGRAARNERGHVVMYADRLTDSMKRAIDETNRRRDLQEQFNKEHGITPKTIYKEQRHLIKLTKVEEDLETKKAYDEKALKKSSVAALRKLAKALESKMVQAAKELDFETAAELRDRLIVVKGQLGEKLQPGKKGKK